MAEGLTLSCPRCGQKNRVPFARLCEIARCGACHQLVRDGSMVLSVDVLEDLTAVLREARVPVLVDFWAPWCGPCRMVAPELAKVARNTAGTLLVVKTNTDTDPRVGRAFGIASIPTMVVFHGAREVARSSGARPAAAIEDFVRQTSSAAA